jgi:hypothetical protein
MISRKQTLNNVNTIVLLPKIKSDKLTFKLKSSIYFF